MGFRTPFRKESNVPHQEKQKRLGAKILFFLIIIIFLAMVFSGLINL